MIESRLFYTSIMQFVNRFLDSESKKWSQSFNFMKAY